MAARWRLSSYNWHTESLWLKLVIALGSFSVFPYNVSCLTTWRFPPPSIIFDRPSSSLLALHALCTLFPQVLHLPTGVWWVPISTKNKSNPDAAKLSQISRASCILVPEHKIVHFLTTKMHSLPEPSFVGLIWTSNVLFFLGGGIYGASKPTGLQQTGWWVHTVLDASFVEDIKSLISQASPGGFQNCLLQSKGMKPNRSPVGEKEVQDAGQSAEAPPLFAFFTNGVTTGYIQCTTDTRLQSVCIFFFWGGGHIITVQHPWTAHCMTHRWYCTPLTRPDCI